MTEGAFDYRDPTWLAEKLGLEVQAVIQHLEEGRLPGVKLGDRWLVSPRKVAEFLDREAERQTEARRKPGERKRFLIRHEEVGGGKKRFELRQIEGDDEPPAKSRGKAPETKRLFITRDESGEREQVRFALRRFDLG